MHMHGWWCELCEVVEVCTCCRWCELCEVVKVCTCMAGGVSCVCESPEPNTDGSGGEGQPVHRYIVRFRLRSGHAGGRHTLCAAR